MEEFQKFEIQECLRKATETLLLVWGYSTHGEVFKETVERHLERDIQPDLNVLVKEKAIALEPSPYPIYTVKIVFTPDGFAVLKRNLINPWLTFDEPASPVIANFLLNWIRNSKGEKPIESYEEFKAIVLGTVRYLEKEMNFNKGSVPIYKIRREFGSRVSHTQFDEWLLQMRSEKLLYLTEGGWRLSPDEVHDSLTIGQKFKFFIELRKN